MRNPLNKAVKATENKTGRTAPGKDNTMNDVFQKVAAATAAVDTSAPKIRAEYVRKLIEAQEAQKAARAAKEAAEDESAFNKACDDESHACDKEAFYRRMISNIDHKMRMNEDEYFGHVSAVENTMNKAAEEFRKAAEKAMFEIVSARSKYEATAAEADKVLEALDDAARVLQVKYRCRVIEFRGQDPEYREDPSEWRQHAVRYQNGLAYKLAVMDTPATYNKVVNAAWYAANNVQNR